MRARLPPREALGDLWGRRVMIIFFLGLGAAGLVVATAQRPWQLAVALTLMGAFAAIYHPVGIPMIVQHSTRPGFTIGLNGLAGNLGIAFAAVLTGFLVQQAGWRMAFAVPALLSIACGITFALVVPREDMAPAKPRRVELPPALLARIFLVMSLAAVSSSMIFNFHQRSNQLLAERLRGLVDNPAPRRPARGGLRDRLARPDRGWEADRRYPLQVVSCPSWPRRSRSSPWRALGGLGAVRLMLLFMVSAPSRSSTP
jgi:hypothetical protein